MTGPATAPLAAAMLAAPGFFGGDGLQAGEVGALLAIAAALYTALLALAVPWFGELLLRALTRREESFDRAVFGAVKRQPEKLKAYWSSAEMFGAELADREDVARTARASAAQLEALRVAIKPIGEIPGQVGRLADAVERLEGAVEQISTANRTHGEALAEIRGEMRAWSGPERRSSPGRRRTDPTG